jgi:hypothetical protein
MSIDRKVAHDRLRYRNSHRLAKIQSMAAMVRTW